MPSKTIAKSSARAKSKTAPVKPAAKRSAVWALQDAKARFSEVVRRARSEGPQTVTVQGQPAVVVMDAARYEQIDIHKRYPTLYDLMQSSPHKEVDLAPPRIRGRTRVRTVEL